MAARDIHFPAFRRTLPFGILMLVVTATGCATPTVQMAVRRPAEVYVQGLRSIAVLDFQGEGGTSAAEKLRRQLQQSQRFVLVPPHALQQAAREPLHDSSGRVKPHVAVQAARQLRIDALLIGKVQRVDTRKEGRIKIDSPTAGAVIEYELVEARTGFVRDSNSVRFETFTIQPESELESALEICAARLAKKLSPHQDQVEVPLASSQWMGGPVNEGNDLAAKGNWHPARQAWQRALQADPNDHAALYNLGVAAEVAGHFDQARTFYEQALAIRSEPTYTQGIARAKQHAEQLQLANQQRQGSPHVTRPFLAAGPK